MTEELLVARAKQGDQEAFAALVEANQNRIYTLAVRMTGNPEDGADMAQEAFLRAWRSLPDFQGGSSFATWLYRLASNVCIDFLRKKKRQEDAVSLDDGENPLPLPDRRFDPEDEVQRRELRRALNGAILKLSDEHRQVIVLRELEGLSYGEIAGRLGLEEGTVKSRIARARVALRNILVESGNFSPPASSTIVNTTGKE